jgi:two-component system NtrC family sensor kinase
MPNQLGKPIMIEWVIHDITDYKEVLCRLKEAKDEFQETHKQLLQLGKMAAIGQLAVGVAHEINNPIGFISNNMECLRQYVADYIRVFKLVESLKSSVEQDNMGKAKSVVQEMARLEQEIDLGYIISDVNKLLEHTDKGLERVKKIVMDLRTFARQGNETMEMASLEEVLESIIRIVWNEIKYKAALTKDYGKIPSVRCNAQALGQVFINLLINAAQSIKDKGEIKIRTYTTRDHACISIADTGCGIAPQDMSKIFTPFFTTKEAGKGTGLGLSVSYDIIKRHGGDILIESQHGQGTIFTVQLPVNGCLTRDTLSTIEVSKATDQ